MIITEGAYMGNITQTKNGKKTICKKAATAKAATAKVSAAGIVLLAMLGLTTCETLKAAFQEPAVSFNSARLTKITFTGTDLLCKVEVKNPNAFYIPFPEIDWEFFINDNFFVRGTIKNDQQRINARSTTLVDVPVSFEYLSVFNTFVSLKDSDQADYKIALSLKFPIPVIGDKTWDFEHKGIFPILKLPAISFKGITAKNFNPLNLLSRIDFEAVWEVENPNIFGMNVKDLSFNLDINGSRWANGSVPNAPQIAAKGKTEIPLAFSINSLSTIASITSIITGGGNVSYNCGGNLSLGMILQGFNVAEVPDFNMPVNFSGTTRVAR
jgi:LEA14-like dessication related protein